MQAHAQGDRVRLGERGRERFYDARGYGRPVDGGLHLSLVEAAHLLYRGDLDGIDGMGFRELIERGDGLAARFLVYKDLRDRGFYLTPAHEDWVEEPGGVDFVVYPRGDGPWDDTVEHRVRVVSEREPVPVDALGDVVLAVVDEESELTYLETARPELSGTAPTPTDATAEATLLDDRVVVWEPPAALHGEGFYGQPLGEHCPGLQLSLVEAAYLADRGLLTVEGGAGIRERGVVPKTGLKFGADFRTYAAVTSVDDVGHSERLVRVLPPDHTFPPRELSLDVRLAHGVRKEMVFAVTDGDGVAWLVVRRLTP